MGGGWGPADTKGPPWLELELLPEVKQEAELELELELDLESYTKS